MHVQYGPFDFHPFHYTAYSTTLLLTQEDDNRLNDAVRLCRSEGYSREYQSVWDQTFSQIQTDNLLTSTGCLDAPL